ncbi:MAG: hypothetical protein A2W36_02855 [Chloroflexi bacterium RBG_16_58_14]|nr:MAG: hypothetical protein A2W36_02855 [Chloroflexi bacterium RBG_16_58_14]
MPNFFQKYGYYLWSIFELLTGFEDPGMVIKIFLKTTSPGLKNIRLRREGLAFTVRSAMDVWSIKETFLDRFYERCGTPIEDGWIILDIGGGIGEFTLFAAQDHPGNTVFAFEPFPESLNLLKANLELNRIANVKAYEDAIWSKKGYLKIDTASGEPSQFTSREPDASLPENDPAIVPAISLADAFARLHLDRCDLLKLDCEGAEYPILLNTPGGLLEKIDRIILEYHDNVAGHTHQDLEKFLSEVGYKVQITPNLVHADLGYLFAQRVP